MLTVVFILKKNVITAFLFIKGCAKSDDTASLNKYVGLNKFIISRDVLQMFLWLTV
jgi:hypothetical protein